jgi:nicotinamidase-related amidase
MSHSALLVIDMQRDLCYDLRRSVKVKAMLDPLKRVIDLFRAAGHPVFYVCFALLADDAQFKRFGDVYCVENTLGAEIIPELMPLQGAVVKKRKHSAFFETKLDMQLKASCVTDVYLTGMQTQICIMTTAADANFRGYRAVAVSDCVLSTHEATKEEALRWIGRYVGEVMSLEEVARVIGYE